MNTETEETEIWNGDDYIVTIRNTVLTVYRVEGEGHGAEVALFFPEELLEIAGKALKHIRRQK